MKSATTTLHHILSAHDGIFIPTRELFFFDIDDFEQHRNMFLGGGSNWSVKDYDNDYEEIFSWYKTFFADAAPGQLVGEDTTTYLASRKAAARIAKLLPKVKLIFILRDPVSRAYSHYWHLVRSGAMTHTFEQALRRDSSTILQRGHYREQLSRYYELFAKDRIKTILFEHFVRNVQATVDDVCSFIGLEHSIDTDSVETYRNKTKPPRFPALQLYLNNVARIRDSRRYVSHTSTPGNAAKAAQSPVAGLSRAFIETMKTILFDEGGSFPPMREPTREFLCQYYRMENRGLEDIVDHDLELYWPSLRD